MMVNIVMSHFIDFGLDTPQHHMLVCYQQIQSNTCFTSTRPLGQHSLLIGTHTQVRSMSAPYTEKIVKAGGCSVVVAQWSEHWQLKPEALHGFDSK